MATPRARRAKARSASPASTPSLCPPSSASKCCRAPINTARRRSRRATRSQIELYGPRVGSTITAHEICDEVVIGPIVAQIASSARALRSRPNLPSNWVGNIACLDPMDIVEITDANLGLAAYPVRILAIEEDDNGLLTFTAEELVVGVSTPALYPSAASARFQPNRAVAAAPVNTPLIYEPPPRADRQRRAGLGRRARAAFRRRRSQLGRRLCLRQRRQRHLFADRRHHAPLRQGVLTAQPRACERMGHHRHACASAWLKAARTLTGTSAASAQAGATLSLVDSELLAYENGDADRRRTPIA